MLEKRQHTGSFDIYKIEGFRFSAAFFKSLATCEIGTIFKVIKREDGTITLENQKKDVAV